MEKWATLEPVKLYQSSTAARFLPGRSNPAHTKPLFPKQPYIGPLPTDIHLIILSYLPIYCIPSYARGSRALSRLARDEKLWEIKWKELGIDRHDLKTTLDSLETRPTPQSPVSPTGVPPVIQVDEDDFGDFASAPAAFLRSPALGEMGDFVGTFTTPTQPIFTPITDPSKGPSYRSMFSKAHSALLPLCRALLAAPHLVLTELFPPTTQISVREQSKTLRLLSLFLSPSIQPVRSWPSLRSSLRAAIDRMQAGLLTAFDSAERRKDEEGMHEAAWASWDIWSDETGVDWELGNEWVIKNEIFYQTGKWDPIKNFTKEGKLGFEPMDEFMKEILDLISSFGALAVRIFPPASGVLLAFVDKLAVEVVGEYITPLLTHARGLTSDVFLQASAATFVQSWRMVDAVLEVSKPPPSSKGEQKAATLTKNQVEDVVFKMFEPNMDEYLDEEVEHLKLVLDSICKDWNKRSADSTIDTSTASFLASHNPAQVKRTLLASFTDVLLLPVTVVPRTVGSIVVTGGAAAVSGIAMLNPQRWVGQATRTVPEGYERSQRVGEDDDNILFENDEEEEPGTVGLQQSSPVTKRSSISSSSLEPSNASTAATSTAEHFSRLQLLLSLDVSLEIIHADRESLKRAETFQGYPGAYGHKVRETIEEIFIIMLQVLGDQHILPGFARATEQMRTYKPAEHDETESVAPLVQFFELVHLGDTIQSMVQVYFDKELAPHIDRTDFLNGVVREKKRFENSLDESVAGGLNAGTDVLMNQVEHIIWTRTGPREYYPQEGTQMELGPTQGCKDAIASLETHCRLLRGSASKEVLEVFYQEIGIRLHAILQKHLKRQIISLEGGFQVIADLNAYHAFIQSLRVPAITEDFSHLKMLGHVYIVADATDLAQIVRDVTRYGGSFRPEDIYEFIQRRSDWKKIEKTVDKAMYNLSFKEDCLIC